MRFLFISYNFSPEKTGIGKYNGEWIEWLVDKGHEVDVITSYPYYPEWKIHSEFKDSRGFTTERSGNLNVFRAPMYIPKKVTGFSRILTDFSFGLTSLLVFIGLLLRKKNYHIVVAVCPSMLNGIFPSIYRKLTGTVFIYHIQDFQLDAAIQLGLLKEGLLTRFLAWIERFQLRSASVVSSISENMKKRALHKGVLPDNYFMLENWVDTRFIKPGPIDEVSLLKAELGIPIDRKIILYSGNLGQKQGIEIILQTAKLLRYHKNYLFVICGDGVVKDELIIESKRENLENIIFLSLQPYVKLPLLLQMADIHLIPQKRAAADLVLPSKLSGILSIGGVVIAAAESGTALFDLIHQHQIGYTVEPENSLLLAKLIETVLDSDNSLIRQNAREFAIKRLSRDAVLGDFLKMVNILLSPKSC